MNNLLDFILNQKEFIRLMKLNDFFKKNEQLYDKIEVMKELQRKYIISNANKDYEISYKAKKDYELMVNEIILYPFVEEYFELLNLFYNTLNLIEKEMEKDLFTIF